MNELVIETRGLCKTFRDFWRRPRVEAVRGLDLQVRQGEVFALLGPNGSGKSTTIKMLLGLLHPSSGMISVLGYPPNKVSAKARIGYLPEVSLLHAFLTPRETLRYYGRLFGLDTATCHARTEALLHMVDLQHAADRPVGELSKGMARRVGLAQALVNNPDLLILDEPTSGLDPVACREVKDLVRLLSQAGKTILMTSHLLADVEDVSDRVAIMHAGRMQAEGRVSDLLRRAEAVRFQVEGLDPVAADIIRQELEKRTRRPVALDHPAMDLETYFLQVVARADNCETATAHFRPAAFLVGEKT
ncbi:MAG: ABC transporter ATP-binding protein [Kiritimatiellia bacterium]